MGQALWEQCYVDPSSGQPLTGSFMDYGMPHAHTLPSFKTEIVEVLSPTNPLGIKAGGEGGTTPALAVIVSAIVDALRDYGIRDIADAGDAVHDLAGDPERQRLADAPQQYGPRTHQRTHGCRTSHRQDLTHRETMLVVLGVLLPVFMGSLDTTILASALPTIGREFGDVHNLPWLVTAYLIANTAITALYGKISDIHGRRVTLLIAISLYMLGSLVCALAPNMVVLILGRVLHGLGGGGLTSTGMVVLGDIAAPQGSRQVLRLFLARPTPPPAPAGRRSAASSPNICTGR